MENLVSPATPPTDYFHDTCTILVDLLSKNEGCVSSRMLRKSVLEILKISDEVSKELIARLYTDESPCGDNILAKGRSFYTKERYARETETVNTQADINEAQEGVAKPVAAASVPSVIKTIELSESKENRQEEARLNTYVMAALKEIYASDYNVDDVPFVFDVHQERHGSVYENVDLTGVHFRCETVAEVFAVETKLEFTAKLVQQSLNYTRFSNRVWIAVPVSTHNGGEELRAVDESLYEYCVEQGLGILACRKAKGRSYEVVPVHYPQRQNIDPVDRAQYLEQYRPIFEQAGLLQRKSQRNIMVS